MNNWMILILLLSLGADLGEGCVYSGPKGNGQGIGKGFLSAVFQIENGLNCSVVNFRSFHENSRQHSVR